MNRRQIIQRGGVAAVALMAPGLLMVEGCTITKAGLESWAQSVDTAVTTVLEGLGASALAGELATYLQQFDEAVNAFPTSGGVFDKILAIAQDIITVLADIGIPATILTIADLCISVVATFISNISNGTVTATVPSVVGGSMFTADAQRTHYTRVVTLTKFTSRRQAALAWNAALVNTPYANHTVRVPFW